MNIVYALGRSLLTLTLALCLCAAQALGTTISTSPNIAVLLQSGQFIAQDTLSSVMLYDATGNPVKRFSAGPITDFAVSPDEGSLLIACADGSLKLCDVRTGRTTWSKLPAETARGFYDACFAQDGKSLIVCEHQDRALVYDALSGRQLGVVQFPPMQNNIMSAALSPDGSQGALVDLSERVFTFDVATGAMRDTGHTGAWPIRYSADGRFFAFRSLNSGTNEQLRVVTVDDTSVRTDIGQFGTIGHIKPTSDGKFLVTAETRRGSTYAGTAGVRIDPATGREELVWRTTGNSVLERKTDFDPQSMIGISTSYRLLTSVSDLRTGAVLRTIDNSAAYHQAIRGESRSTWRSVAAGAATVAGLVGVVILMVRRMFAEPVTRTS